ncbi:MAG: glycosyltransferase [Patescibacteria group bacterium]|nr:glycosyltransferase [Patescibacteria group bacterium]
MTKILIVIPAYNEEKILATNVLTLFNYCQKNIVDDWEIVIANNLSTDCTATIAKSLADKLPHVSSITINTKGKGVAIAGGWNSVAADVYCFMDADLATDLSALPSLIAGIKSGYDLVVGSRYVEGAQVSRTLARRIFSFGYRLVLQLLLGTKIKDLPCGFKAINSKIKESILPLLHNQGWFFDTELVIVSEKLGFKIKEIPVTWFEPRGPADKSRVNLLAVAWSYLQEVIWLRSRLKKM